jgi:hypothetical protein
VQPNPPSEPQEKIATKLGRLVGKRIPGGCDQCDAYQTVEPIRAGLWHMTVHHDEWCPRMRKH